MDTTTAAATAAHHQWPQGIGVVKTMEATRPAAAVVEKKQRPQKDQALNCPRCNSTNTKFCYYNNYSLSQPRYFCKTCRRYWTEGGSLRNVPVGGGSRKNRRPPSSSSSPSSSSLCSPSAKKFPAGDHHHLVNPRGFPQSASQNNPRIYEGQDLNLAYPPSSEDYGSKFVEPPYGTETRSHHHQNPSTTAQTTSSAAASHHMSAMELLKTGMNSRGLSSFMPAPVSCSNAIYSSTGFPLHEFKSSLNFSLQGFESEYGSIQEMQENSTAPRLLFPMEDLKQEVPSNSNEFDEQNRGQGDATGYWNGMLGGGGSW